MSRKRYRNGLVVGKFSPLHRGHQWTISHAAAACDRVLLLSYSNPEFPQCSAAARRRWLTETFPEHEVVVLEPIGHPPNDAPDEEQQQHLARLLRQLKWMPDAMFASEYYAHPCVQLLSRVLGHTVVGVIVDLARQQAPISATQIREAPHLHLEWMPPAVRADFVPRVVLLGGESTGKTTLAEALATHFQTLWVPEYGRERWALQGGVLQEPDLLEIGLEQCRREDAAARHAAPVLVCDTSPLTTMGYSQWMFGRVDEGLARLAERRYSLHVLCDEHIAFEQDGTRRDDAFRREQQDWYRQTLARRGDTWIEVQGSVQERVEQVEHALRARHLLPAAEAMA